ncbi:MAG: sigma 54-interacting transcriptional regulator [Gemmataceae bacterium]
MPNGPPAFLVLHRDDGFGDVFPLRAGQRCTVGRATTNRIVLKDDMCSREHAEVLFTDGSWYLRDLGSLNGTRLNTKNVSADAPLSPRDMVELGNTQLMFVEDLKQLPEIPKRGPQKPPEKLEIRQRLSETHYLPIGLPTPVTRPVPGRDTLPERDAINRNLSRLYRLALEMGGAETQDELVTLVLDGLLELVNAEVGAILFLKDDRELEVAAHKHRDDKFPKYQKVSQYVSNEVLASRQAILAEDVSQDRHLRIRESLTDLQVSSLICAPVLFRDRLYGLIHLYCIDPNERLDGDDLDLSLAIAHQFGVAVFQLQRRDRLTAANRSLRDQLKLESELVGTSESLQQIEGQIARVAETNATVLIRGESGVGKELVARAIHFNSPRRDGPFVTLNCAALTETLLESELFGHEKGAFTGATERMIGKFEAAHQGTIFLDEIGEMAMGTQAKFLRVLEGHPFERVGGNTPIRVDVRVVSATNLPLEQAVRAGTFRRDLFFRLQVVEIQVPPLRDRRDDIPILADHFLTRFVKETGRKIRGFTPEAMQKLKAYHWPGNVRELRNVIERAVALGNGPTLDSADIWLSSLESAPPVSVESAYEPVSLSEIEKRHIDATLRHTDWNKSQTAIILGIERSTLDRKIKTYELKKQN